MKYKKTTPKSAYSRPKPAPRKSGVKKKKRKPTGRKRGR